MSRKRDIKFDDLEISKYAFRECKYSCLQYPEKKAKLSQIRGISAAPLTGMPRSGGTGKPTERQALKAAHLEDDIELIETTARDAGGDVYPWLLKNVTEEGSTWEMMSPPIGRRQFFARRRMFFYLLAVKKGLV
jgi:hypothetical protein